MNLNNCNNMYDLSDDLSEFLSDEVALSYSKIKQLRKNRKTNIDRLKKGLDEYNSEHGTKHKLIDDIEQGSVAMFTYIKKEENNYDIDIAVIFEFDGDLTPLAARRIVKDALERKTKQFNAEPEVKTSCVRIRYEDGYHIDFAVFRRTKNIFGEYKFEHAGNVWNERDITGIKKWFDKRNKITDGLLRKVVRLTKQFCSRWSDMPGGLILSVLCSECLYECERLDVAFCETMKKIRQRLSLYKKVFSPVDTARDLTARITDIDRLERLEQKLDLLVKDIDVLYNVDCNKLQAYNAWYSVFEHDFWSSDKLIEGLQHSLVVRDSQLPYYYDHTEQFIEDDYPIDLAYDNVYLETTVVNLNGFRDKPLDEYLAQYKFLIKGMSIRCKALDLWKYDCNQILWKVKNEGIVAKRKNMIRGQIRNRGECIVEPCSFRGPHYIECYLIKNNVCVGIGHVDVPIGE